MDASRQSADITIRLATMDDVAAINDIYNHYVPTSTCTYDESPSSIEARIAWFTERGPRHPVTAAELDGQVVGWGSLSPFRARSAYRFCCENSVYVHHALHGRGIGGALLADLIERARAMGYRVIIAGADAAQGPSIALHAKFGFVEVGRFRDVGFKFGRWLDVVFMELHLG